MNIQELEQSYNTYSFANGDVLKLYLDNANNFMRSSHYLLKSPLYRFVPTQTNTASCAVEQMTSRLAVPHEWDAGTNTLGSDKSYATTFKIYQTLIQKDIKYMDVKRSIPFGVDVGVFGDTLVEQQLKIYRGFMSKITSTAEYYLYQALRGKIVKPGNTPSALANSRTTVPASLPNVGSPGIEIADSFKLLGLPASLRFATVNIDLSSPANQANNSYLRDIFASIRRNIALRMNVDVTTAPVLRLLVSSAQFDAIRSKAIRERNSISLINTQDQENYQTVQNTYVISGVEIIEYNAQAILANADNPVDILKADGDTLLYVFPVVDEMIDYFVAPSDSMFATQQSMTDDEGNVIPVWLYSGLDQERGTGWTNYAEFNGLAFNKYPYLIVPVNLTIPA